MSRTRPQELPEIRCKRKRRHNRQKKYKPACVRVQQPARQCKNGGSAAESPIPFGRLGGFVLEKESRVCRRYTAQPYGREKKSAAVLEKLRKSYHSLQSSPKRFRTQGQHLPARHFAFRLPLRRL